MEATEKLPVGTKVRYHGSLTLYHGEYLVTGYSDLESDPWKAAHYPHGFAYDLWPVGVPRKMGLRHFALYWVRPESVSVAGDES